MEFIQKYAKIDSDSDKEQVINEDEVMVSDQEFIDGISLFQDQNPSDYYGLKNVTRDFEETEMNYDEFDGFKIKIECFKKCLKIFEGQSKHSFYNAMLLATISKLHEKNFFFQHKNEIEIILGKDFCQELKTKKDVLILNLLLSSFKRKCHQVNDFLLK